MTEAVKVTHRATYDGRFYEIQRPNEKGEIETIWLPGVTTILHGVTANPFLEQWRMKKAEELGVEGVRFALWLDAERGRRVHTGIERLIAGDTLSWFVDGKELYSEREWKCLTRWQQWADKYKPVFESSEIVVYSEKYGYAGTADGVGTIRGQKFLFDWKSGKGIYPDYLLQVSAYVKAYNEMLARFSEPVDLAAVLALGSESKKAGYDYFELDKTRVENCFEHFRHRLQVWYDLHGKLQPKRDLLPLELSYKHHGEKLSGEEEE